MAFTKTHILCTFLATQYVGAQFQPEIFAYSIIPDSICCLDFGECVEDKHAVSHFEVNPATGVASSMIFPTTDELKFLSDEDQRRVYHSEKNNRSILGNAQNLGVFFQTNSHLPDVEFKGVLSHLVQDGIYHDYLKSLIVVSKETNGNGLQSTKSGSKSNNYVFKVTGGVYSTTSLGKLKTRIGQQTFRYLVKLFKEQMGCETEGLYEFFKTAVFPAIEDTFCEKMAKYAIRGINLSDDGSEAIPNKTCEFIVNDMIQATAKIWK